jgi:hypothetical protein
MGRRKAEDMRVMGSLMIPSSLKVGIRESRRHFGSFAQDHRWSSGFNSGTKA